MRIPYVADPPPTTTPEDAAIVQRIRDRRAPRPLQSLDRALLHSPPVADGWNSFLGAIRTGTSLPADLRELAICRVAVCNQAWYEWKHHAPLAAGAGVSREALEIVKQREPLVRGDAGSGGSEGEKGGAGLLNDKQWAVLLYTDDMTRNVHVQDETFDRIRGLFSDQEVTEITATVMTTRGASGRGV